ncbi:MAG: DNA-binding domain-containing protein [Hyphomicrobiales bacterium]
MSIKYALYPNHLTEDPDDYVGVITERKSIDLEALVKYMTRRGTSLTDTEVEVVLKEQQYAIKELLMQGYTINLPTFKVGASMKGIYRGAEDCYDPKRHSVEYNVTLGKALSIDTSQLKIEKTKPNEKAPEVMGIFDRFSGTKDDKITPKGSLDIKGYSLKIHTEVEDEGVFFICGETKTRAEVFFNNTDSILELKVPDSLVAGKYYIEVRKRFIRCKKLTKCRYDQEFIVE